LPQFRGHARTPFNGNLFEGKAKVKATDTKTTGGKASGSARKRRSSKEKVA
jgi:hypothetical protein